MAAPKNINNVTDILHEFCGSSATANLHFTLGAAEGSPGLLAIGLGCLLFVLGVFKDIKSEQHIPVFVDWWK